ncbi:MAG: PspC domain-containing protein [Edaphocola sp.]
MNKIININLAGRLIPIDEGAYETLRHYLDRLKAHFSHERGGDEILRDMEDRIGELLQERLKKGAPCVMIPDINEVIGIMGSPEDIESETTDDTTGKTKAAEAPFEGRKKLMRNAQNQVCGGVCAGMADYVNIDPLMVRIAFALITLAWGTGFFIYILLWALLPVGTQQPRLPRRRLYRDTQHKVVGGVCSGLASYFDVAPLAPRVIFALPLLGMIFFSASNHSDIFFFPVLIGGIPTLVLLYFILWASVPKASTVAEKLEMRGEKVDIQSLSQAIKEPTYPTAENGRNGLAKFLAFFVKAIVFCILAFVLLVVGCIVIALLAALFGIAGSSIHLYPFSSLLTENQTQYYLIWACVAALLLIPLFGMVRLVLRLFNGNTKHSPKWLTGTLAALFIAAVFGLFWIGSSIIGDFGKKYNKTYVLPLQQPLNDTLIIRQMPYANKGGLSGDADWDSDDNDFITEWNEDGNYLKFLGDSTLGISNIYLHFSPGTDNAYHLSIQKSAQGRTYERARMLAEAIDFNYQMENNVLYLPANFVLPKGRPFRAQKISIDVEVPKGKVFKAEGLDNHFRTNHIIRIGRSSIRFNALKDAKWANNVYYTMTAQGPRPADSSSIDTDTE